MRVLKEGCKVYSPHGEPLSKLCSKVECGCGFIFYVPPYWLASGRVKHCGCGTGSSGRNCYSHGREGTPTHTSWSRMRSRCNYLKSHKRERYAERGITVCDRWGSFKNFLEDMGRRPSPAHSIERIDNDKGYEPGNCKWATRHEQDRNKSTNHWIVFKGEKIVLEDLAALVGITHQAMAFRVRKWPEEKWLLPKQRPPLSCT